MIHIALKHYASFLVASGLLAGLVAPFAQPHKTLHIDFILIFHLSTQHTSILISYLFGLRPFPEIIVHKLMIIQTSPIILNIYPLTTHTVLLLAFRTPSRTLTLTITYITNLQPVNRIHKNQSTPTRTFRININDQLPRLRTVEVLRQLRKTTLAQTKVTFCIVINSIITNRSTDTAYITDVI